MTIYIKLTLIILIFLLGFAYSEYDTLTECENDGYASVHGKRIECK